MLGEACWSLKLWVDLASHSILVLVLQLWQISEAPGLVRGRLPVIAGPELESQGVGLVDAKDGEEIYYW